MHETQFANQIIEEAKKHGKVKSITVEVGDLAHLPLHDLEECLVQLVDWEVKMVLKKGLVQCACGYRGVPKIIEKQHAFTLFECPKCGNVPKIIDGEEIVLKSVEIDQ